MRALVPLELKNNHRNNLTKKKTKRMKIVKGKENVNAREKERGSSGKRSERENEKESAATREAEAEATIEKEAGAEIITVEEKVIEDLLPLAPLRKDTEITQERMTIQSK
jgi:hypothetical protein